MATGMEFDSVIQGYHVYKEVWTSTVGEELNCRCERDNFNPLRTVVTYMRQGIKYFTVRKQIIITLPAFTL